MEKIWSEISTGWMLILWPASQMLEWSLSFHQQVMNRNICSSILVQMTVICFKVFWFFCFLRLVGFLSYAVNRYPTPVLAPPMVLTPALPLFVPTSTIICPFLSCYMPSHLPPRISLLRLLLPLPFFSSVLCGNLYLYKVKILHFWWLFSRWSWFFSHFSYSKENLWG